MDTIVAETLVGRTVAGRYQVDELVAVGGMATVYRATDLRLDRPVALKVMKESLVGDPEFVARFRSEARAAARLADAHVVAVHDQGESGDLVYLAMEYVPGRTVRTLLSEYGRLSSQQALWVLDGTLQALAAAHAAGFIHRDVKPENVLVSDAGVVKVTDFGLARALAGPSPATGGVLIGTAAYLAPEQVSLGDSDERSDVYQAGVLLYEMLVGAPPHRGDSPWAVAYQHVNTDVPPVRDSVPGVPPAVDALVTDATARDRTDRIASVPEFLDRARAAAAHLPAPAPLPGPGPAAPGTEIAATAALPAPRSRRFRRGWLAGGLVLLVAAVLAAVAGWAIGGAAPFNRADVPRLAGATEEKATAQLRAAGFDVTVADRRFSEKVPAGAVVRTDPVGGSSAGAGSTIGLVLSLGPERYEIPEVRNLSVAEASAALSATNLRVAGERRRFHDTIPAGTVIGTSPPAGRDVKRRTPVALLISRGPAPVDVPDVTGLPTDDAVAALADLGLAASVDESIVTPLGRVYEQNPAPGTRVTAGTSVTLSIF